MSSVKPFKQESKKKKTPEKTPEKTLSQALTEKKRDETKTIVLQTLNIIPHILFVIVNIVKDKKYAIVPTASFIKNFVDNNLKDITEVSENKSLVEKSKKFLIKFADLFLIAYSKTPLIDKGLIFLAFIDIVTNEIPNILKNANAIKYVEPSKIFTKILMGAKDIDKEYGTIKQ